MFERDGCWLKIVQCEALGNVQPLVSVKVQRNVELQTPALHCGRWRHACNPTVARTLWALSPCQFLCFTASPQGRHPVYHFVQEKNGDGLIKCIKLEEISVFVFYDDRWFPGTLAVGAAARRHSLPGRCEQFCLYRSWMRSPAGELREQQ